MPRVTSILAVLFISGVVVSTAFSAVMIKSSPIMRAFDSSLAAGRFAYAAPGSGNQIVAAAPVQQTEPVVRQQKSVTKAAALSLLLPGAGQYYLGHKRKARGFFIVEAATWAGMFAFRTYGRWKKDDYFRYASLHANADLSKMDDEFQELLSFYDNIDQYNTVGRLIEPSRPYVPDNPVNHWDWDSDASRETYRTLKNSSKEAYRRAKFMIGIAVLTRVVAVVDAVRDGRRQRSKILAKEPPERRLQFSVSPFTPINQLRLTLLTDL